MRKEWRKNAKKKKNTAKQRIGKEEERTKIMVERTETMRKKDARGQVRGKVRTWRDR